MIVRSGIDTIEISRLADIRESIRKRFISRVYTTQEITQARDRNDILAGLFAAKEAVSKALGTGIGRVHWQDIEILHLMTGQPVVHLHGHAKIKADELGLTEWSVSISHDRSKAIAVAVAIGDE
ncbi:MAG: holo-ACP synthase [Chloroflexota bacterium]|jgi:holo-[acyl-carrier-protein] synthase|nr:holo-ACP synthase [Chloroflexota bacterium]